MTVIIPFSNTLESGHRTEYLGIGLKEESLKDCQAMWEMNPKFLQQLKFFLYFRVASDTSQIQLPLLPSALFYPFHFSLFPTFFPDLRQAYINSLHLHGILQPQRVFIEMVSFDLHKDRLCPYNRGKAEWPEFYIQWMLLECQLFAF